MLERFSQRLLTLLQFTRMALVFTAISNSLATYLLSLRHHVQQGQSVLENFDWYKAILIALTSIGLYGFGMSFNDLIDRRRDSQLAPHRPIPSGRIRLATAHVICAALILLALIAGGLYSSRADSSVSFILVLWTILLIAFYDLAGKYLVAPGLITLGLIRFFHALIPDPHAPLLLHPLTLFTHVALLSAVAYAWEEKRPPLTRIHWAAVIGGVLLIDLLAISLVQADQGGLPYNRLSFTPRLFLPAALFLAFIPIAMLIRRRSSSLRQAGQTLMLSGLLYLITYDAAFVGIYVGWKYAVALLLLLPASYLMVQLMRWWSKLMLISQAPSYQRIRSTPPAHK